MKFKYNPLENKLWRIEENYLYEVSEESRQIEHLVYLGTKIIFQLGNNHWLTFHSFAGLDTKVTVYYTKPLKNGELIHYEKKINPGLFPVETTFEFSKADRVENITLKNHEPK